MFVQLKIISTLFHFHEKRLRSTLIGSGIMLKIQVVSQNMKAIWKRDDDTLFSLQWKTVFLECFFKKCRSILWFFIVYFLFVATVPILYPGWICFQYRHAINWDKKVLQMWDLQDCQLKRAITLSGEGGDCLGTSNLIFFVFPNIMVLKMVFIPDRFKK